MSTAANGNQLAVQKTHAPVQFGNRGLEPDSIDGVFRCCNIIRASGMAPKTLDTTEKMVVAAFHGRELGFTFMQSIQNIAVINGRPGIYGDAAISLVQSSDVCEYVKEAIEGEGESMKAVCISKRKGRPNEVRTEFSVSDAKKANLWGKAGPWTNYPKRMLQFRARGFNFRDNFADKISGLRIVEELQDFEPESQLRIGSTITSNDLDDIVASELLPAADDSPEPTTTTNEPFVGDPVFPTAEEVAEAQAAELKQGSIPF